MKVFNKLMLGAAALALLPGCSLFQSKVSYDKFHEKAVAAHDKGHSYTKAVVSGDMSGSGLSIKMDKIEFVLASGVWQPKGDSSGFDVMAASAYVGMEARSVPEDDESTYYVGNGFKVTMKDDDGKGTAQFNAAGLLTSYKAESDSSKANITIKYSK